jgi:acyl-CoA thioesterase II
MTVAPELAEMLNLRVAGEGQYEADNLPGPSPVVFGGQILAQAVSAACRTVPDKELKNLHTVFARGVLLSGLWSSMSGSSNKDGRSPA